MNANARRRRPPRHPLPKTALGLMTLAVGCAIWFANSLAGQEISIPVEGPRREIGRWLKAKPSPVLGIHSAVLPTGKVLLFSYPDMMGEFQTPPPTDRSVAYVWNPKGGRFKDVTWDYDVFCSGHSFLADGRLYVSGGWDPRQCVEGGIPEAFLFDPFTEAWSRVQDMRQARYYPSNITLSDGRVGIFSGYNASCHPVGSVEVYTPGQGTRTVAGSARTLRLYPELHLLSNGQVAMVGPDPMAATFDFATGAWRNIAPTQLGVRRNFGTSFQVPGRPNEIMICGGYRRQRDEPSSSCEVIDLGRSQPRWEYTAPMHYARAHLNPVILPDKTVLIVGGGAWDDYNVPVHNAELYDPTTDTWTLLPPQRYGRMYHSTAVLLPDGRVLSAGHDQHRLGIDEGMHQNGDWNEIYRPPYLFRGARPKIRAVPAEISYGQSFDLESPQAGSIESVVLISLSATTHSTNTTQRLVELDFNLAAGDRLVLQAPSRASLAPPGYYMLFILNGNNAVSRSKIVRLGNAV